MTTQSAALSWIPQQLGKSLDYDGHYGMQCVDLVAYYCQFLGVPPHVGNANTWWESGYTGGGQFQRVTSNPQPGDIVVFKPNAGNGYGGHIACVYQTYPGSFKSLDQNWYNANSTVGSPAAWVTHAKDNNIYGYLRPLYNGGNMDQIAQLQQQVKDMQAQIDILRPGLVNANKTIDALHAELDAERKGYELQIADLRAQLANGGQDPKAAALLKAVREAVQ